MAKRHDHLASEIRNEQAAFYEQVPGVKISSLFFPS